MTMPCGVRNYKYATDMAIFRTKTQWVLILAFVAWLFTAPLYMNDYWLSVANRAGIMIVAATGLNIMVGYCGQLSIGHTAFMAVGAFTSAALTKLNLPFPVALIAAGLGAGIVGLIFGLPSVRVKGFYLAISSFAALTIILWIINNWTSVTGGFNGTKVPVAALGSLKFNSEFSMFYLIFVVTVICTFLAKNLVRTRTGRAFVAIRDNDLAAEVMGVNVFYYKMLAFFIGCFLAGIAGSLMAHWSGSVSAENFPFKDSILYVGIIIIGGLGTSLGPILGVVFIEALDVLVTKLSPALQSAFPGLPGGFTSGVAPVVFGLAIVLFLILEPRGIAHRWNLFKASYRLWPFSY